MKINLKCYEVVFLKGPFWHLCSFFCTLMTCSTLIEAANPFEWDTDSTLIGKWIWMDWWTLRDLRDESFILLVKTSTNASFVNFNCLNHNWCECMHKWLSPYESTECNYSSMWRFSSTVAAVRMWISNYTSHELTDVITHPWAPYQIHKIAGCACAGNCGNVFPAIDFKGNR